MFMHPGLYMPTGKVATISAGEGARSEAPNRSPLPEAVIDVASIQSRLFSAGICERQAKRAFQGGFWNIICAQAGEEDSKQQLNRTNSTSRCLATCCFMDPPEPTGPLKTVLRL